MDKKLNILIRENLKKELKKGIFLVYEENEGDIKKVRLLYDGIVKKLRKVYKEVTNKELELPKIEIKVDPNIKDGKIAGFDYPENDNDVGVMGIKPKAFNDLEYLKYIITHELIHAAIGEDKPNHLEHSGEFKVLADKMGLPKRYQD